MRKTSKPTAAVTTSTAKTAPPTMPGTDLTREEIAAVQERLTQNAKEVEELLERVRRVRGTRDNIQPPAVEARPSAQGTREQAPAPRARRGTHKTAAPPDGPLPERLDVALKQGPNTTEGLAKILGVSPEETLAAVDMLRRAGKVANIGASLVSPRWCRVPGDNASAAEINDHVRKLISDTPLTWGEIAAATGARPTRISGAIGALQRDKSIQVINAAPTGKARWWIVPAGVKISKIRR